MVCEWGMSEKMGPISYGAKQEELFLGREVTKHQEFSESTAQEIDAEVKVIITEAMVRSEKILKENMDALHSLSKELLEREILDSDEIEKILKGEVLPPLKKNGNGNGSEEVPDHVKDMMKKKDDRSSEEKPEEKSKEKPEEKLEEKPEEKNDDKA
jgi:cell division protease FtsH